MLQLALIMQCGITTMSFSVLEYHSTMYKIYCPVLGQYLFDYVLQHGISIGFPCIANTGLYPVGTFFLHHEGILFFFSSIGLI